MELIHSIVVGHSTLEMTRRYTQALGFDDVYKRHVVASPVDRLMKWGMEQVNGGLFLVKFAVNI